ncbi:hypothetical protein BSKO_08614 [Bryopsis sp. KO-2023]|nr:hypothetical protein BSKO_08614 [Bryopsis sp. KO-2023]
MVAAGSFPYGRPGQAGCKLNYGRDEVVVSTSRGWDESVKVDGRKYNRTYSDCRASNTLKPAHINQTDFRTTKGSTYIFDKTRSHAFYRDLEREFLETCRSRKKKGDNRFELLVKMYGPEGAEAMTVIETMKRVPWRRKGKTTAEDLAAVQALDAGDIALTPTPTQDFATTLTEETSPTLESDEN